jgi:hypothetical protein
MTSSYVGICPVLFFCKHRPECLTNNCARIPLLCSLMNSFSARMSVDCRIWNQVPGIPWMMIGNRYELKFSTGGRMH